MTKKDIAEPEEKQKKAKKERPDEIIKLKKSLKTKETKIQDLMKKIKIMKEESLRQMAEMENQRKRLEREKTEYFQYALAEVLKETLAVLDNFERALGNDHRNQEKRFREGIELIYRQYQDTLKKQGVHSIDAEGKKFDPNFHQAFITEESTDVEQQVVIEEFQKGYTLHGRLLRPALVKVAVPKKNKSI